MASIICFIVFVALGPWLLYRNYVHIAATRFVKYEHERLNILTNVV